MTHDDSDTRRGEPRVGPMGRRLAEALRAFEERGGVPEDPEANHAGAAAGRDDEARLVARARAHREAPELRRRLERVDHVVLACAAGAALLAALAGIVAARAALGVAPGEAGSRPVNVFWALGGLLGLQTALLAAWAIAMLLRGGGAAAGFAGAAIRAAVRRLLAGAARTDRHLAAAIEGAAVANAAPRVARWRLSAASHLAWSAFDLGTIAALLLLLGTREYLFVWETTILPTDVAVRVVELLAAGPRALGIGVPDPATIVACEAGATEETLRAARVAFSGLLVGSVLAWGLLPRLALAVLALLLARLAARRRRLDVARSGFARALAAMRPVRVAITDEPPMPASRPRGDARSPGAGAPVILGYETERPLGPWPPALHAVRWIDLGFVDGREAREHAVAEIAALAEPARAIVVVGMLGATPDRGFDSFLDQVAAARRGPLHLLLTGGAAWRDRVGTSAAGERVEAWREFARGRGDAPLIEVDLDHPTETSLRALAAVVGGAVPPADRAGGLESAFAAIESAVGRWTGSPGDEAIAALHGEIARSFRAEPGALAVLLDLGADRAPRAIAARATEAGRRLIDLVPPGLRRDPRWIAAGALAGAAGCVATALMLAPAAAAALPLWSAIGAATAALATPAPSAPALPEAAADASAAVRAAALFALLLALQGRGEEVIGRVLERTLAPPALEAPIAAGDAATARRELDALRHRLDLALAEERRR